jgi:hypothetical protein
LTGFGKWKGAGRWEGKKKELLRQLDLVVKGEEMSDGEESCGLDRNEGQEGYKMWRLTK